MPNKRATTYVKQKVIEVKGETESCTIIVGDFRLLSTIDRTVKQTIQQGYRRTEEYHQPVGPNLIYRIHHPTAAEYMYF